MRLSYSSADGLALESPRITLRGLRPVLNGAPVEALQTEALVVEGPPESLPALHLRMAAPALGGAALDVAISQRGADAWALRYALDGDPGVALDSFGVRFEAVENLRVWLRNGYFSWDGSRYVEPGPPADPGYAMTQLLPREGAGSVVIGFERHERFQHTFRVDGSGAPPTLTIETVWDRKTLNAGSRPESETLVIFEHAGVEDALRAWAKIVAAASALPPRVPDQPITGWSSWYNLYAAITEENILEHLRGVAAVRNRETLPLRFFQIDDGFTPEMGDWLAVKPQFPRGMKPLLDDIRAAGFAPGLWIAPFMVGNRSRLYREHPGWVVRDRLTGGPLPLMTFYGEFRWHKRSEEYYILDTTHPDAFAYLRQVFRTWRRDWGCEYFKTDFMHFPTVHGPDRAVWHTPGLTRIEIWRQVAGMIRGEIGDAMWLGCGCPLWASVGLVDGVRIGRDVGVSWSGERAARSLLRDQATRNFANGILWQADPDCILLRERFHELSEAELRSLAIYFGMTAGLVMTSDALDELSDERLRLWKLVLQPRRAICHFPLLGQPGGSDPDGDPVRVQVRQSARDQAAPAAIFVFNTGDAPAERTYPLARLGLPGAWHIVEWGSGRGWPEPVERISLTLAPHDGALLFASRQPLAAPPDRLP
ncbi:MAG: alpha-galactosidase [Anaerolineae bacterium]|nr:alpha-galactosidase [Anaerolineae bacterium]